jgi:hypothetical protein
MFAIFAISAGLTYTLGCMTGPQKRGWAVFGAMAGRVSKRLDAQSKRLLTRDVMLLA